MPENCTCPGHKSVGMQHMDECPAKDQEVRPDNRLHILSSSGQETLCGLGLNRYITGRWSNANCQNCIEVRVEGIVE